MDVNLSNLRIYDETGLEQPYITNRENRVSKTSLFHAYEILESAYRRDTISYLIFGNPKKAQIDNVSFVVQNTDVQKRARLSGSNDQENWFVIKSDYLLHSMKSEAETSELKLLNFPLSDYAFFKLEIDDNWKLPINILKVGYYDTQKKNGLSTAFTCNDWTQNDSARTSYLKLTFPERIYIDELGFEVSGAEFYSRSTEVLTKVERIDRRKKKHYEYNLVASFDLNSNSPNTLNFEGIAVEELYVRIQNKDNAPLRIDGINAAHLNTYIVMELKPGFTYTMVFGDAKLQRPNYDMEGFKQQLNINPDQLGHGALKLVKSENKKKGSDIFGSGYLLWSILAVVGILLAFVSFKMIREIGK